MFNAILFATDLGPFTDYCLQYAADLAAKCNARLVIVHAVEPLGELARAVVATYIEDGSEALTYDCASTEVDLTPIEVIKVMQGKAAEIILAEAGVSL